VSLHFGHFDRSIDAGHISRLGFRSARRLARGTGNLTVTASGNFPGCSLLRLAAQLASQCHRLALDDAVVGRLKKDTLLDHFLDLKFGQLL
jgi:hypothetical protein